MGGAVPAAAAGGDRPATLVRFDRVERLLHWVTAGLVGVLALTGLALYAAPVEPVVGRRALLAAVHAWCGVALPVPALLSVAGPWGANLRRDLRRADLWTRDELRWLATLGQRGGLRLGKFNPGQKLNLAFTVGAVVVLWASGAVMKWFGPFPDAWRTGATFVHDVAASAVAVVVCGHILFALTHRDALRAMLRGKVSREWAARHAPAWLDGED